MMKRTCNACKALSEDSFYGFRCSLGFPIEIVSYKNVIISAKPKIQCPKPLTLKEYYKIQE
ncbi:hypothetical protein [Lysinibacillus xylanilyticus]|uniref:hypothetical protein n=1 Tax=Lysinibacillus xylanilyticus TaxID=582475 RepID=UPI003816220B